MVVTSELKSPCAAVVVVFVVCFFLAGIAESFQIGADGFLQLGRLGELVVQFGDEAWHLYLEGVAVVFDFLGADVAAGREDVAMRGDFGGGGGFAEARYVNVAGIPLIPGPSPSGRRECRAPCVIGCLLYTSRCV